MEFNKEIFRRQYPVVGHFVQHLAYNRGLRAAWDGIQDPSPFLASTTDGHLELALIAWCKVFGSRKEDLHWTKIPIGKTAEQAREDFRFRVLSRTGFTQEQWEDYQKKILTMRDKYVAHLDVKNPITTSIPLFDEALQVAYVYQEWVRQIIKPVVMSSYPFSADYERWKVEAPSTVTTFFSHSK